MHVAARITAEAAGGQIFVSDAVRQQVEPGAEWRFVDSGLFWLKGFDERWRLFEVSRDQVAPLQRRGVMPPPLTPMIGRDSEQANLRRAVTRRWPAAADSPLWPVRPAWGSPGWSPRSAVRPRRAACGC